MIKDIMIKKFNQLFENSNSSLLKKYVENLINNSSINIVYEKILENHDYTLFLLMIEYNFIDVNFNDLSHNNTEPITYIDIIERNNYNILYEYTNYLINKGANINAVDIDNKTPIMLIDDSNTIDLLLKQDNLDLTIKNDFNDDVFDLKGNDFKEYVKKHYPKQWEKYEKEINLNNFNI